jgi:hypothetical protein
MARAIGCSLRDSSRARTSKSGADSSVPARLITPVVRVPVLSSTTVSIERVDSSASGPETRMPSWDPRPDETANAVGVARPSAQGQAMMRTVRPACRPIAQPPVTSPQTRSVATAMAKTIGTNTAEIRSARRATAGLPVCARLTRSAMAASVVSAPTRVALTSSTPEVLIVAPVTVSPGATSTGTDSPVSIASSIAEWPVSTSPSVAIFSPGRTRKTSPTTSSSIGTCTSVRESCAVPDPDAAPAGPDPSRSTVADFAPRSSRALSAAVARVFALSSVSLPMSRNTVIAAAASNHTWYSAGIDQPQPSSTARPRVT